MIVKGLMLVYVFLFGLIVFECIWIVLEEGIDVFGLIGYGWIYFVYLIGVVVGVVNLDLIDKLDLVGNVVMVGCYFKIEL